MLYQTKDGRDTGYWDPELGSWESLPGGYRTQVRDGIRMAKKEAPIDMLVLPVKMGGNS